MLSGPAQGWSVTGGARQVFESASGATARKSWLGAFRPVRRASSDASRAASKELLGAVPLAASETPPRQRRAPKWRASCEEWSLARCARVL
jgi:hypothetical protein